MQNKKKKKKKKHAQVGVALEEDTIHIPDLTFEPVGAVEQTNDRGDRGDLVGVGLDSDPRLVGVGEEVIDDLEPSQHTCFPADTTTLASNLLGLVGKSTAVMSTICLYWHWVWSRRKVKTGRTAWGGM